MFIFTHATLHFYGGLGGGITYIKRKLTLDKDFKELNSQTKNSKNHLSGSLHFGLIKPIKEKFFLGIEGFIGHTLYEDFFKPQINFGTKILAGFQTNERLRFYTGIGIDFMKIKSLKITLNNNTFSFAPIDPINYRIFPLFLGNIGAEFFIIKKLSIRIEGGISMSKNKTFSKRGIDNFININGDGEIVDSDSSEKYTTFKTTFGLFHHGGF